MQLIARGGPGDNVSVRTGPHVTAGFVSRECR